MSALNLAFLGSPLVTHAEMGEITFPNRKTLALFAYLALESDHPHSRETLMGLLWPERSTPDAQNNLRVTWARLRKQLVEDAKTPNPYLIGTRLDLQFNAQSDHTLDIARFQELLEIARTHPHANRQDCDACQTHLAQALDLVRGEFLEGFYLEDCPAFEEWQFIQRERLHLQMIDVLEELATTNETKGHFEQATAYTRRQLELDSLHDSAHHRLLRLLAYQGQYNQALSQYQSIKNLLHEELGLAPDAEMVKLARQIETRTLPVPSRSPAPEQPQSRKTNHLPENLSPFFGRETELDQLSERLASPTYRLISLVGPGGIGKTRLALEAARNNLHRYHDGTFFVPLEGLANGAEIPAAIAAALDVSFSNDDSARTEILQIFQDKQSLLILDNLEHVIEEGTALILDILQTAPNVVVLITSRERLNTQTEDLFHLSGLPYPEQDDDPDPAHYTALRLFADRAHRLDKTFKLSPETIQPVAAICRLVEGLPLGIELATTWVRELSVEQIAESLAENIALLETDLRDISPRHRNFAAVFEYSWRLLPPDEQKALLKLAVFRGGFTREAASKIAEASSLTLNRLYYQSLIRSSGNGRYTMHELLRQLALRKLQEDVRDAEHLENQHSQYFLTLLVTQNAKLKGHHAAQVNAALRLEIDNIRQGWRLAVQLRDWDLLCRAAPGFVSFFNHEGLGIEGVQLIQLAIDSLKPTKRADHTLPNLLAAKLSLSTTFQELDDLRPTIDELLVLARNQPELARLEAEAYHAWSTLLLDKVSDPQEARVYLDQAFAAAGQLNDPELDAILLCESGRNYLYDGQFDLAIADLQRALNIFKSLEHILGQAMAYSRLAPAYAEGYNLGPALLCDQEALRLYSQINYRIKLNAAHNNLAETFTLLGAYPQAETHALKSLEISREQGNKVNEINTLSGYAAILNGLEKTQEAETQFRKAIAEQKARNMAWSLRYSLLDWGEFLFHAGRLTEAEITFNEALTINRDTDHLCMTSQTKLAMVHLAQGKPQQALTLVEEVWATIEPTRGEGLPFPIKTMFECHTIFQACGDPRATEALNIAAEVLKRTATGIDDPEMRASFLNNIPVNRKVRKLWEQADESQHRH